MAKFGAVFVLGLFMACPIAAALNLGKADGDQETTWKWTRKGLGAMQDAYGHDNKPEVLKKYGRPRVGDKFTEADLETAREYFHSDPNHKTGKLRFSDLANIGAIVDAGNQEPTWKWTAKGLGAMQSVYGQANVDSPAKAEVLKKYGRPRIGGEFTEADLETAREYFHSDPNHKTGKLRFSDLANIGAIVDAGNQEPTWKWTAKGLGAMQSVYGQDNVNSPAKAEVLKKYGHPRRGGEFTEADLETAREYFHSDPNHKTGKLSYHDLENIGAIVKKV